MLRCAKTRSVFRCVHVPVGVDLQRRLWLDSYLQIFVCPFASRASRDYAITNTHVKVSRNHGKASISESDVCRNFAHRGSGDAMISVRDAGRQDVDVQFCTGDVSVLACSHHDTESHSRDGVLKWMPNAKSYFCNGYVRRDKSLISNGVSDPSCQRISPLVSLQTLLEQPKLISSLRQKIELLESEQFSLSYAKILIKKRAFQSCLVKQLATVLQELKKSFACPEVVHEILVKSSNVLLEPIELLQQRLKVLHDFQVEENLISKLCSKGRVLSVHVESLQNRLMFYNTIGLTVEARNMMLSKGPLILVMCVENKIQPALKFLESTGLTKDSILKLVQHCPDIFYMSLDTNVIKKFEYFTQLGLSVKDFPRVFRLTRRFPIEVIEEHVQSLKDLGFADNDVRSMLKKQPAVLAFSPENLKSKVEFLIHEQNRDMAELVNSPSALTLSLKGRMVPRFNVVNKLALSKEHSLSSILYATDSVFEKRFCK